MSPTSELLQPDAYRKLYVKAHQLLQEYGAKIARTEQRVVELQRENEMLRAELSSFTDRKC